MADNFRQTPFGGSWRLEPALERNFIFNAVQNRRGGEQDRQGSLGCVEIWSIERGCLQPGKHISQRAASVGSQGSLRCFEAVIRDPEGSQSHLSGGHHIIFDRIADHNDWPIGPIQARHQLSEESRVGLGKMKGFVIGDQGKGVCLGVSACPAKALQNGGAREERVGGNGDAITACEGAFDQDCESGEVLSVLLEAGKTRL